MKTDAIQMSENTNKPKLKTQIYANNMASRRSRMRPPISISIVLTNNGCIEAILIYM